MLRRNNHLEIFSIYFQRVTIIYESLHVVHFTVRKLGLYYKHKEHIETNISDVRKVSREILEPVMTIAASGSLSSVPNGRIIDFEIAELKTLSFQNSLFLWVSGSMPAGSFEVILAPRIYHDLPEYWGIEVTIVATPAAIDVPGDIDAAAIAAPPIFERSVPLTGITGSRGIAVIGANQVKRIEIASESF